MPNVRSLENKLESTLKCLFDFENKLKSKRLCTPLSFFSLLRSLSIFFLASVQIQVLTTAFQSSTAEAD